VRRSKSPNKISLNATVVRGPVLRTSLTLPVMPIIPNLKIGWPTRRQDLRCMVLWAIGGRCWS
jgi:hypothetical protein